MKVDIDYTFVPYSNDDYKFVYETKKVVYKKYVEENWGKWDEQVQLEMFNNFIKEYGKEIKIIVSNNQKIGFWHGEMLSDGNYEIGNICIIPDYQGKGLGTEILKNILKQHQYQDVYLRFFKSNPVVNLYKRLGFKICEELPYHFKMVKEKSKIKLNEK